MATPTVESPLPPDRESQTGQRVGPSPRRDRGNGDQAAVSVPRDAGAASPADEVVLRAAAPRSRRKIWRLLLLVPILLLVSAVGTTLAYRYWYESTYFVITENAQVTGDLVQVGSLNPGRVIATRVDVGDQVYQGQEIATVAIPQQVALSFSAAPRLDVTGTTDTLAPVRAPLTGVVAARFGHAGGTVASGQPLFALIDPQRVWVKANIEESRVARVQPGQVVEVYSEALAHTFSGRVEAITPASAATFSLLPSSNVSGSYIRVIQYVPVRIAVDSGDTVLPLGTSAHVRIQVRQPNSTLPLPWQP